MSRALAEERDRIKRQIEELEETLGAAPGDLDLLSSDASSGNSGPRGLFFALSLSVSLCILAISLSLITMKI